ncbi:hypothetical protein VHEMI08738 [[Torrubiella] hemipterigena]|uniref:U3 small nucleolar ribonucleoprotein protein MPP10 n=1 Tax=[Torrubiella] hemipterigena TaxID=1531966 RepID=A0A0A1TNR8_9HYPO|nr:hypothetical protein VHEMI08738 [[Torrubiella] hemipterigena]
MATDTLSSNTSSSHTLSVGSAMASTPITASGSIAALLATLDKANRHAFLQPSASLPTESLNIAKETLEAFAGKVSDQQLERLKESRKRKRGGDGSKQDVLKLRKVYIDGFQTNQVWKQAERIINSVLEYSEDLLMEMEANDEIVTENEPLEFDANGFEVGSDDDDDEEDEEGDIEAQLEDEDGEDLDMEGDLDEEEFGDAPEDDGEEGEEEEDDDDDDISQASYEEDPDGLNDGFFSLADFNKQSQWFEEQDAKGNPYTDQGSDDEQIDWDADPNAPAKPGKAKKPSKDMDDEEGENDDDEESDEDDGPTFGDMALDAPEGESEDEDFDINPEDEEENNANGVFYKDFFAPPARKKGDRKPRKDRPAKLEKPTAEDLERAMADVKRDLFDDESEVENSDDALSETSAGDPKSRRSAHERRQAKLADEIRKLEAASVAKREWTLSGEATAVERPTNSLLEQDLDFEYVGKPVPVITPEVSESIEDLIKRRILAQEFDEVLRRRPEAEASNNTRRGLVEVDDTKSSKGLGELYEEDHVKNSNPDTYVSQSDEKLAKEEREIENMWKDLSSRLDALSSWHYKPKPVAATLSVVADVATITMEDAQPATAQAIAGESSRMAPQEVYKAGSKTAAAGEVVAKGGLPVARQEMSREDKSRQRRRHKERVRKAGAVTAGGSRAGLSKKAQTIADLKKGGVKVINRRGEITDVDGNKVKAAKAASSSNFKL